MTGKNDVKRLFDEVRGVVILQVKRKCPLSEAKTTQGGLEVARVFTASILMLAARAAGL